MDVRELIYRAWLSFVLLGRAVGDSPDLPDSAGDGFPFATINPGTSPNQYTQGFNVNTGINPALFWPYPDQGGNFRPVYPLPYMRPGAPSPAMPLLPPLAMPPGAFPNRQPINPPFNSPYMNIGGPPGYRKIPGPVGYRKLFIPGRGPPGYPKVAHIPPQVILEPGPPPGFKKQGPVIIPNFGPPGFQKLEASLSTVIPPIAGMFTGTMGPMGPGPAFVSVNPMNQMPMNFLFATMPFGLGTTPALKGESLEWMTDVLIVIDASPIMGHVDQKNNVVWEPTVLEFLTTFIDTVPMGPKTNRVGVVVVGEGIEDMIPLTHDRKYLKSSLKSLRSTFRGGCTNKGIWTAKNLFFQYGRPNAVKRALFLNDGASICPTKILAGWSYAQQCGIDLLHIGFGPGPRQPIPVGPGYQSFWNIQGPADLSTIVEPVAKRVYIAPVHGFWSHWSQWNPCSARSACEVGYQQRFRVCDNPSPEYGGMPCGGEPAAVRMCHPRACIDNKIGHWTRWTEYTPCSVHCGIGSRTRVRSCVTLSGKVSATCKGKYVEVKECIVKECPVHGGWSRWSKWGICSVPCGQGVKMRARQCDNPFPKYDGKSCSGMSLQEAVCDTGIVCSIHGGFGPWSKFGPCDAVCGMGTHTMTRKCDSPLPQFGGLECDGLYEKTHPCDSGVHCPIHGQWSPWNDFGLCSAKCGVGSRVRNRFCDSPAPQFDGVMCAGPHLEELPCDSGIICPIDGNWSPWGDFHPCSAPCGVSSKSRERICNSPSPMYGGMECIGVTMDEQPCDTGIVCPINGGWGKWNPFTPCSVKCGKGVMKRSRLCDSPSPMYGGGFCVGLDIEEKMCDTKRNCPVHGFWGTWGPWGHCSAVCELGFRQRTRLCNNPAPLFGGMSCDGTPIVEEACDTRIPCPIPGGWSNWVEEGPCSAKCGSGTIRMVRMCDSPAPMYGGEACNGPHTKVLECDTGINCPVPGRWSPWSIWGPCSVSCGVGVEERGRNCDDPPPMYGGPICKGDSFEQRMCDTGVLCPISGDWSPWSQWLPCSVKCGVGFSARTRLCDSPAPQYGGIPCDGLPMEEQPCDTRMPCPIDGAWSGWSGLSPCSSTCGVGEMVRSRLCNAPAPKFGGLPCKDFDTDLIPCDTLVMCPMHGNWGPWTDFSGCSVICGKGKMKRTRACDSPFPAFGGLMCPGDNVHVEPCDTGILCPINGGWSPWSDYSLCGVPCGMGIIQRTRVCNAPVPINGGKPCPGFDVHEKVCDTRINCPVDGNWGPWSQYGDCSVGCGRGIQQRRRLCNNPPPMFGGGTCFGTPIDEQPCDTGFMCPVDGQWTPWSDFQPCSVKCGMGIQRRIRDCAAPVPLYGGLKCAGPGIDERPCDTRVVCPLNGGWSPWSSWAACSVVCGTGVAKRARECSNPPPMYGGLPCKGPVFDKRPCDTGINCPIHGGWSPWGGFSACSVPCAIGIMQRHRICDSPLPMYGGDMCAGDVTEGNVCDTGIACSVDGGFGPWSVWSMCSAKCGDGMQFRTRACDSPPPMNGGIDCFGDFRQDQLCSSGTFCPIDGGWSPWAQFSPCSKACGIGVQKRGRDCDSPVPMYGGHLCDGKPVDVIPCDSGVHCPLHGDWSLWAPWTDCSVSCDTGIQQRVRSCSNPAPLYGGFLCKGIANQEQVCNTGNPCPMDGQWSPWSDWLPCGAKCGTGFHSRVRACDSPPPLFGGRPCFGDTSEKMMCDSGIPCPVPGNWSPWSDWSGCSASCGMGSQQRIRDCTDPKPLYGGALCQGIGQQGRECETGIFCPIDGSWAPWSKWSLCSAGCGMGMQGRTRLCTNPPPNYGGLYCAGQDAEKEKCNSGTACPVDGGWSDWSKFGPCSAECGMGMESRIRTCTYPVPSNGGNLCFGGNTDDRPCDTGTRCPVHGAWTHWAPWSPCDVSCGVGRHGRTRSCTNPPPDFGGLLCKGGGVEEAPCDTGMLCPIHGGWSPWRPWTACSADCGIGMMERTRVCSNPRPKFGGFPCKGLHMETQQCDSGVHCPIHGQWSAWSPLSKCSHMCGVGTQTRVRDCSSPAPQFGGIPCVGVLEEDIPCDTGIPCPIDGGWGHWSEFGPCSAKCGFGMYSRKRFCDSPVPMFGGADCFGQSFSEGKCDTGMPCAVHGGWSYWSPWSGCSAMCGMGQQSRVRECNNPKPLFTGVLCRGPSQDTRKCDSGKMCPIHGGWADWTPWDKCNALCGVGMQQRSYSGHKSHKPHFSSHNHIYKVHDHVVTTTPTSPTTKFRECSAPYPMYGGYPCKGPDVDGRDCKAGLPCPVDGDWAAWTPWSGCSDICGVGIRTRTRTCENPPPRFGGKDCVGTDGAVQECDTGILCPIDGDWSVWSGWSGCSVKCGAGMTNRERLCDSPAPQFGGLSCSGVPVDSRPCDTGVMCPVHGDWSKWGPWNKCAADCGVGVQNRMRMCNNPPPMFGGFPCKGFAEEATPCDTMITCPIDGNWSPWSGYSACTADCGFGTQERTRLCNNPQPQFGGRICAGKRFQSIGCDTGVACPVNGNWGPWRKWSKCSAVCGVGKMKRSRVCNNPPPAYGGMPCEGPLFDVGPCDTGVMCPIHGGWGMWAPWSGCSEMCGIGVQARSRECSHPPPQFGGQLCIGLTKEVLDCDTGVPCTIDGDWSMWGKWLPCNAKCGIGRHSRARSCDNPAPQFGGKTCAGPPMDDRPCDTMVPCPIHGGWSYWSPWSACTKSCGLGLKTRVRACIMPSPLYGGILCRGPDKEVADCDAGVPCPVHGGWGPWKEWTKCNAACGVGFIERHRLCDQPPAQFGGIPCQGHMAQTVDCDSGRMCPVHGQWAVWSPWSGCSQSCGLGVSTRVRECSNPRPRFGGYPCKGLYQDVRKCDAGIACPVDGQWSVWSGFSPCSAKCGVGIQERARSCDAPRPGFGGLDCVGPSFIDKKCDTYIPCPVNGGWTLWSVWSGCAAKCGSGMKTRLRKCADPAPQFGGIPCDGPTEEVAECESGIACPIDGMWGIWSKWDACDAKCGFGSQVRFRTCTAPRPQFGGMMCAGLPEQVTECNTGVACPVHGGWSPWSHWDKCDVKCGAGKQVRMRTCSNPRPQFGGMHCKGLPEESQKCDTQFACPIHGNWGMWGPWNQCIARCGMGFMKRVRLCDSPLPNFGGLLCAGFSEQKQPCDSGIPCSVDGEWSMWSEWSLCSATCGAGIAHRKRFCDSPAPKDGGNFCKGPSEDGDVCNTGRPCPQPQHGAWSIWGPWQPCTSTCGAGLQKRMRACNGPAPMYGGRACPDYPEDSRICNTHVACPIHGGWSAWAPYGPCTKACIGNASPKRGHKTQYRLCDHPEPQNGGDLCFGPTQHTIACDDQPPCGVWSGWKSWSRCDCQSIAQLRTRSCDGVPGSVCDGAGKLDRSCSPAQLKADCSQPEWTAWSKWTPCSQDCGPGVRESSRICAEKLTGNPSTACEGPATRSVQCQISTCPLSALNCTTECKWDNGIGYAIFPGDCSKFVQCDHMYGTPQVQHCSWGLFWSLDMLQCVYPAQSECSMCSQFEVGTVKPYFISCRSYWECTKGKMAAMCCPPGQTFDTIGLACMPDTAGVCNEECPPTEVLSTGKCIFKPSLLGPNWYEQLDAGTWVPRPCPKATVFSKGMCQCVLLTSNAPLGPDECLPSLHMTFDDLKSDTDRNVGIHIENVNYLGDGTAQFDGTGAVNANIFANAPWGSNVYVYIRFKPTGNGRRQGLIHNSGCGPSDIGPSLFMGIDREPGNNITMKFATVPERPWLEYDFVNVTTTNNAWIDAWFKFGDGQFKAEVDGLTAVLDIPGNVARRHGALNIGGNLCLIGNESFGGFVGTVDEVRIYKCKPHR